MIENCELRTSCPFMNFREIDVFSRFFSPFVVRLREGKRREETSSSGTSFFSWFLNYGSSNSTANLDSTNSTSAKTAFKNPSVAGTASTASTSKFGIKQSMFEVSSNPCLKYQSIYVWYQAIHVWYQAIHVWYQAIHVWYHAIHVWYHAIHVWRIKQSMFDIMQSMISSNLFLISWKR